VILKSSDLFAYNQNLLKHQLKHLLELLSHLQSQTDSDSFKRKSTSEIEQSSADKFDLLWINLLQTRLKRIFPIKCQLNF